MLVVDLAGYEGPLDLLLDLARRNQIDLTSIKILPLAEQYLDFVQRAKALRIELAADILVMAAWLAFLKSRLIAPAEDDEGADGEELAEDLAFRLRRLEAMREAADRLFARPRLGREVFGRGAPEVTTVRQERTFKGSLYDLLTAYGAIRQDEIVRETTMEKRPVFSLVDARRVMERIVGGHADWLPLDVLVQAMPPGQDRRAVIASTFGAALEMAREGKISVRQNGPFAPLFLRATTEAERREADG
ncbi:segregation/condensation protein A [Acuticoccus sp. 2012]|uniref:Segregation and condensation protein A n=2 Tax=Acuticoccus mangrovi TaxID=2796142 RepID=A0A934MDM0_9HYPH|nr:ScpA family protein [Acuticoccus mangrovi]MBJ3776517.1 segregation/condensation protein A [Acuticoccus mangrovi]